MSELKLSTPWVTFYFEIEALFKNDPDVIVELDEEDLAIKLYVDGVEKAEALAKLLPDSRNFGNITVPIAVIPANKEQTKLDLFVKAFEGNPALSYVVKGSPDKPFSFDYVVFRNEVVQFFNDDLSDVNGNESTLFEDIARDVFEDAEVYFCTDIAGNPGVPA